MPRGLKSKTNWIDNAINRLKNETNRLESNFKTAMSDAEINRRKRQRKYLPKLKIIHDKQLSKLREELAILDEQVALDERHTELMNQLDQIRSEKKRIKRQEKRKRQRQKKKENTNNN